MPARHPAGHTPETIKEITRELRQASAQLQGLADTIDDYKLAAVVVPKGTKEIQRAMRAIKSFTTSLDTAILEARQIRGDLGPYQQHEYDVSVQQALEALQRQRPKRKP